MNIMIIVPKVVKSYIAQFPEVTHNAYPYFNYDNRVVEERVERGDFRPEYKNAYALTDQDYDSLVKHAQTLKNPILAKYSARVANEDALHTAIRSFADGMFDGKVNASHFEVLVRAMTENPVPVVASKKKAPPVEKQVTVKPHILKQLGLKPGDVARKTRNVPKGITHLVKTDKGIQVKK